MQENWIGRSKGLQLPFAFAGAAPAGFEAVGGLHHPSRHPVRRQLRRRRRPTIRWPSSWPTPTPRSPPSSPNAARAAPREAEIETAEKIGFDTGLTVAHPVRPGLDAAGLDRQLHPDGLRHGRDLRLPGPRPARPGLRPQVRPAGPARWCCRPARTRPTLRRGRRGLYRPGHASSIPTSWTAWTIEAAKAEAIARIEAAGPGRGRDRLPPARLGRRAPALLGLPDPGRPLRRPAASCRCRPSSCRSCCPRTSTFDEPGNPLERHPTWKHTTCPTCGGAAPARDRHARHLRRLAPGTSPASPIPKRRRRRSTRRRPTTGCRSTSISAASSTRSCTCSTPASSPAP